MKHKKIWQIFPMKDTGHVTEKLTLLFPLLWIFCHFSINIRIEVYFFVCIGKWKDTIRVLIFEKLFGLHKSCAWPVSFHFPTMVGWVVLRINVDLAIFQPYLDLEAGDNQSLKIQVARPGIEPRSSCSASQELNHSATAAPTKQKRELQLLK